MKGLERFAEVPTTSNPFETLKLYNGEVTLYYDDKLHLYWTEEDGVRYAVPSATSATGMVDKSAALTHWVANTTVGALRELWQPNTAYSEEEIATHLQAARTQFKTLQRDAMDIGTLAHMALERYLKSVLAGAPEKPEPDGNEKAQRCIEAGLDWISKHNIVPLHLEKKLYSREHKFSGTVDNIAWMTGCGDADCCPFEGTKRALIDYKSSKSLYEEYFMQISAYKHAWEEEFPDQPVEARVLVRLDKEGDSAKPFESLVLLPETYEADMDGFLCALGLFNWKKQISLNGKFERAAEKALRDSLKPVKKRRVKKVVIKDMILTPELVVGIEQ